MIAQSYGQWRYDGPGPLHAEDERIDPDLPASMVRTANAVRYLESAVTAAAGTVLRYGFFYGPGTGFEYMLGMPLIGDGAGVWSFIHTDDAAAATLAAIERGAPGVYNVADDTPVPIGEWLPRLASGAARAALRGGRAAGHGRGDGPPAHADPGPVERQGAARARLGPRHASVYDGVLAAR